MLSPVCLDAEPRSLSRWVPAVPCPFYQASHPQESILQGQIPTGQSCLSSSRWGLHSTRAFKGPESYLPHLAIHGGPPGLEDRSRAGQEPKGQEPEYWGTMNACRQEGPAGHWSLGVTEVSAYLPGTEKGCGRDRSKSWSLGTWARHGELSFC